MAERPPRRMMDSRQAAEAAFKQATAKPIAMAVPVEKSAPIPGAREMVTLRIDRDIVEHFQADGPGWQDRMIAALRSAAGL